MNGLESHSSPNVSAKINEIFTSSIINKHEDIITKCREKLQYGMKNEIREVMKQGLFRLSWENDVKVIITIQSLLQKYDHGMYIIYYRINIIQVMLVYSDVSEWLGNDVKGELAASTTKHFIHCAVESYLEFFILSNIQLSPRLVDRLHEDFEVRYSLLTRLVIIFHSQ